MIFYADTSFLASLYLLDANNITAERSMRALGPTLPLTEFGAFELRNAIWGAVFRRTITGSDAGVILQQIEREIAAGFFMLIPCPWDDVFRTASKLSQRHTPFVGCRALDILHVASADVLGSKEFLTFDQRQSQLARQIGMGTPS